MPSEDFGSILGKNLKAVKLGQDGGIEIPVRANGQDGIVFGVDAIAQGEHAPDATTPDPDSSAARRPWWRRLLRRP